MQYDLKNKSAIHALLETHSVLVFQIRNSRLRAKRAAIMEVYALLSVFDVIYLPNGPLGDIRGIFSFMIPRAHLEQCKAPLSRLGYSFEVYILDFAGDAAENETALASINPQYWKGKPFAIRRFYTVDSALVEQSQVHNRQFAIYDSAGNIKEVTGYRGDGTDTGRRALPVEDARLMLNLAMPGAGSTVLDPFAGAGGIVFEAANYYKALTVLSADIDPLIAPGLARISHRHVTADVKELDLGGQQVGSVVTELPFADSAGGDIAMGLERLTQMLSPQGKIVLMCAARQRALVEGVCRELGLAPYFEAAINRKGTDVCILAYGKGDVQTQAAFFAGLELIY